LGELGGKEEVGREDGKNSEGKVLIYWEVTMGGVYKTAYRATIPKRAKLTTRGNSQVLALLVLSQQAAA
jgi:hypothetical protein